MYKNGMKTIYTIVVPPNILLQQNDRVRRVRDGKIYRITSNSSDMMTPDVASEQYAQVMAEVIQV